jgi:hypothetical protein
MFISPNSSATASNSDSLTLYLRIKADCEGTIDDATVNLSANVNLQDGHAMLTVRESQQQQVVRLTFITSFAVKTVSSPGFGLQASTAS